MVVFAETAHSLAFPGSSLQRSLGRKGLLHESQEERGAGLMAILHQGSMGALEKYRCPLCLVFVVQPCLIHGTL